MAMIFHFNIDFKYNLHSPDLVVKHAGNNHYHLKMPNIFDNPRLKRMLLNFFSLGIDKANDPFFSHLIRWNNTSKIKKVIS